jgi:hypothetical protein
MVTCPRAPIQAKASFSLNTEGDSSGPPKADVACIPAAGVVRNNWKALRIFLAKKRVISDAA